MLLDCIPDNLLSHTIFFVTAVSLCMNSKDCLMDLVNIRGSLHKSCHLFLISHVATCEMEYVHLEEFSM
jgi:hypothetical protein